MLKLEIFGILVQITFLISIFDIYKENIHTCDDTTPQSTPIAERVVIFVVSGLRPDMIEAAVKEFNNIPLWPRFNAEGVTVSETPTTSKNGFIAFTAGVNEGLLSMVPIDRTLDSVFDHVNGSVTVYTDNNFKYFTKYNRINVDSLDKVEDDLKRKFNETNNKITLIHTTEILKQINSYECLFKCVDIIYKLFKQIDEIVSLTETKDLNRSVYILMSDHGVTPDGRFGSNSQQETVTFLSIWGEAVSNIKNISIKQIQLANAISTVLGVDIPRNSLAVTPVEIFNKSNQEICSYKAKNAVHLSDAVKKSVAQIDLVAKLLNYMNLEPFTDYNQLLEYEVLLHQKIKSNNLNGSQPISDQIILLSLNGINKINNMTRITISVLMNVSYTGWILMLCLTIIIKYNKLSKENSEIDNENMENEERQYENGNAKWYIALNSCFVLFAILGFIFVVSHNWPLHYFSYLFVPMLIWHYIIYNAPKLKYLAKQITMKNLPQLFLDISLILLVYELLVWSSPYRFLLVLAMLSVTIFLTIRCILMTTEAVLLLTQVTSGLLLILTLVLHKPTENQLFLNISSLIWISVGTILAFKMRFTFHDYLITVITLLLHICSLIVVNIKTIKADANIFNVVWSQFVIALILPFFGGSNGVNRLKQISLCIASVFLLFTTSFESLVLFVLFMKLIGWFMVEDEHHKEPPKTNIDLPIIFAILVVSSYCIMGNTDDLNFIEVGFTQRITLQDNPFISYTLLTVKHCLVLFMLQTFFAMIIRKRGDVTLFILTLLILNCIGYRYMLQLLFWPHYDTIAAQLTRHCVVQTNTAFLWSSFSLAKLVTSVSLFSRCNELRGICRKQFIKKKA